MLGSQLQLLLYTGQVHPFLPMKTGFFSLALFRPFPMGLGLGLGLGRDPYGIYIVKWWYFTYEVV